MDLLSQTLDARGGEAGSDGDGWERIRITRADFYVRCLLGEPQGSELESVGERDSSSSEEGTRGMGVVSSDPLETGLGAGVPVEAARKAVREQCHGKVEVMEGGN